MAQLFAIANSKIFIGGVVANPKDTVTAADFTGETWLEIDGWTAAGSLGDTTEIISQKVISSGRVRKVKGTSDAGNMENTFIPNGTDPGQMAFKAAIRNCKPYKFKIEWGAGCLPEGTVTAAGAVLTSPGHGLAAGQPVRFSNEGGALPTGLTAGNVYYVIPTGLAANTFQVSATPGGAAITTTGAGTGTHTVTAQPVGQTDLFYGLALPGAKTGGDADTAQLRTWTIAIDSNVVEV